MALRQIFLYVAGLCIAFIAPFAAASFFLSDAPVAVVRRADAARSQPEPAPLEEPQPPRPDPNRRPIWIAPTKEYKHPTLPPSPDAPEDAMAMGPPQHEETKKVLERKEARKERGSADHRRVQNVVASQAAQEARASAHEGSGSGVRDTPPLTRD